MTLPAAAARAPAAVDPWPVRGAGRSISAARAQAQQQTSCTSLLLSIDGTDRRTPNRYRDACRILCGGVNNIASYCETMTTTMMTMIMMTMLMFLCVVQAMKLGLLSGRYVWLLVMLVHLRITSLHSL